MTQVARSDFDSTNRTIQDAVWDGADMKVWDTILALDEHYAINQGLPHSQRWPWDENKGVYIMHSTHHIHCTVSQTIASRELEY